MSDFNTEQQAAIARWTRRNRTLGILNTLVGVGVAFLLVVCFGALVYEKRHIDALLPENLPCRCVCP